MPQETWRNSRCKAILKELIANKQIDEQTDINVLHASNPEFNKWDKSQFKRNLKALFKASTKPKKVKWAKSKAKQLLREDIINRRVTNLSDPEEVCNERPECKEFTFGRFKQNLKNLVDHVLKEFERMQEDCEAYGHDVHLLKDLRAGKSFKTPWHKSDAKPLLEADMDAGKHLSMFPRDLYKTRIQYREFSLEEFRKRINQERHKRERAEANVERKKRNSRPPSDYSVSSVPRRHARPEDGE